MAPCRHSLPGGLPPPAPSVYLRIIILHSQSPLTSLPLNYSNNNYAVQHKWIFNFLFAHVLLTRNVYVNVASEKLKTTCYLSSFLRFTSRNRYVKVYEGNPSNLFKFRRIRLRLRCWRWTKLNLFSNLTVSCKRLNHYQFFCFLKLAILHMLNKQKNWSVRNNFLGSIVDLGSI